MRLVEANVPPKTKKQSKYDPIIDEFIDSDMYAARLDGDTAFTGNAVSNINLRLKRRRINDVAAVQRDGQVYLTKTVPGTTLPLAGECS